MGEYIEIYIDWTEAPEVDVTGIKERDGKWNSVRFCHRNVMLRLHPDEVVRAMAVVARGGMRCDALDEGTRSAIGRYLRETAE